MRVMTDVNTMIRGLRVLASDNYTTGGPVIKKHFLDAAETIEQLQKLVDELEQENLELLGTIAQYPDSFQRDREALNKFALEKKIEALQECVGVCGFLSCTDSLESRIKQLRKGGE